MDGHLNGWVSKVNVTSSLRNSCWIITLPLETVTDVQASYSYNNLVQSTLILT